MVFTAYTPPYIGFNMPAASVDSEQCKCSTSPYDSFSLQLI